MHKQVLACDFDDVFMPFNATFSRFHNQEHGTKIAYEDISSYDMASIYRCPAEILVERVKVFYRSVYHANAAPIQGAVEALRQLSDRYLFEIVTSRSEEFKECTEAYIDRFFKGLIRAIHFTNGFAASDGARKRRKSEVCREIGAVALVEDALSHAEESAQSGIQVFLPDRPWNRTHTPLGVVRVNSWDEIVAWGESR